MSNLIFYGVSQKGTVLPEYQINGIENCLVLLPVSSVRVSHLANQQSGC